MRSPASIPARFTALISSTAAHTAAVGTLVLAGAGAMALWLTPHWTDEAIQAERARHALVGELRAREAAGRRPEATPAARARPRPSAAAASSRVAALLDVASLQGLRIIAVQQRWTGPANDALQVTLPVQGRYADVRRFVEAALRADHGVALDSLRLDRDAPDAPTLRADLQFTLHDAADPGLAVTAAAAADRPPATANP